MSSLLAPAGPYTWPYVWAWFAHNIILVATLVLTGILAVAAPFNTVEAAYGRLAHTDKWPSSLGPLNAKVNGRIAWWFMEAPTIYVCVVFYFIVGGNEATGFRFPINRFEPAPLTMFCLYQLHYLQRTCVYPFTSSPSEVTLAILLTSFVWNSLSAYLIASFISDMGVYPPEWLYDPRFIIGTVIYTAGYIINRQSDHILSMLRKDKDNSKDDDDETKSLLEHEKPADDPDCYVNPKTHHKYYIPHGALFNYVSCPNYFGELLIWLGFAMLTFSLEGLTLFLMTFGNLCPRAIRYHRFYQEHFPNYPKNRKTLIPFVF
jgi:3-oxo-5-alpha-steroid 4-dehydrogenase 1